MTTVTQKTESCIRDPWEVDTDPGGLAVGRAWERKL